MRIESFLLIFALLSPSLAIRGERKAVRLLRGEKEKDLFDPNSEPKGESNVATTPKEKTKEKSSKDKKDKDKDDKKDKKDKKCKKAKKDKKSKKSKEPELVRRYAEVIQEDDNKFCLHPKSLSEEQCAQVMEGEGLPKDGSVKGGLNIELVRTTEQSSDDILQRVDSILSSDTNPRFVGCESLKAPPLPKKKSNKSQPTRARRYLEEYYLVPESEDRVDVTGVDFEDLSISTGACTENTELAEGLVCDVIRSGVEIYYQTEQEEVTDEDKEDMYNLLVETIYAQAEVGSFGDVGSVASVRVASDDSDSTSDGDDTTSQRDFNDQPSDGDANFGEHKVPIMAAAGGFAALFAGGYWYAMGEDENEEKNEQTDESDSDDERRGAGQTS